MKKQFKLFENESLILYVELKEERPKTDDLLIETDIHIKIRKNEEETIEINKTI